MKTLCLEQGFTFICNSAIAREMLWRDGLHLTNEGTNMLSNNFLQYLKNVPLGNDNRIFTDWQTNQGRAKGSYKGIEEFSPKDPEVPKLSNNTNSKLELSCITNIKKIRSENIDNVIIGTLNINSLSSKFDDLKVLIDILIIPETKLDDTYSIPQFHIDGYSMPYILDRNRNGGGVIIYVRDDIPGNVLRKHLFPNDIEGIFVEINYRKSKWLLCGTYHPPSQSDQYYFDNIDKGLDVYCQYEEIMLVGDFNA